MIYYNENDLFIAEWLSGLMDAGEIPNGTIDTRSITEVQADDVKGFTQCHFFAGIGGWPLALCLAGWPDGVPVWSGSCPCQPFSAAGKGLGTKDERHLWPEFFRLIRECRPERVFGEQVPGAIGKGWLDEISADLETEGYAVGAVVLGAHSVGAPHIRQRLFWVADTNGSGESQVAGFHGRQGTGSAGVDRVADAGRSSDERELRHHEAPGATGRAQEKAQQRQRGGIDTGGGGAIGGLADARSNGQ